MPHTYNFSRITKNQAFFRQWNNCAHCGGSLLNVMDHAHHVFSKQLGKSTVADSEWIKSVDNCVILCENCHWRVHENGHYLRGAVAAPEFYPFSHGKDSMFHKAWAQKLSVKFWTH